MGWQGAKLVENPVPLPHASEPDRWTNGRGHSASILSAEVITDRDRLSALKPDYDHLHEVTGNTLPFALHEWHVAWWDHLAQNTKRVRDALRIHVFRAGTGECVGIVPLILSRREIGYLSIGMLCFLGSDPNITELRPTLIAPGHELPVATALRRSLAAAEGWDWIRWSCKDGPLLHALTADAAPGPRHEVLDYVLDLAPTWEALRSGLKRNVRESLRHCYNSLKRDGLDFAFEVAETPEAVQRAIDLFLPLHTRRANLKDTVVHPNRFDGATSRQFLYDVCDRLARRGVARVFLLRIKGEVVAARIGFVVGSSLYLYYSGFDPEWAKYGVATTVVAEAMKYAISLGLATVNLSTGTDVSKTRWGANPVAYYDVDESRPSLKSQALFAAYLRITRIIKEPAPWMQPLLRVLPRRGWV
jgi:CelD/BcsL family acetyltransferase involved in cellulose biosynthesis